MAHETLDLEYEQINENIRLLTDVRFKLLAFLPTLGGLTAFALSYLGFTLSENAPQGGGETLWFVALVSIFGILVTSGITMYDQRNSELYNALNRFHVSGQPWLHPEVDQSR